MKWINTHYQHLLAVVLLLLVGTLVMWPLTHSGLFTAHDIWHQVARFYHYHTAISDGFWPPGWIMNLANGYGYPLFYFSYHLPWMMGEMLLRMGFAIPEALKLLFGGAVVASGLTMYWFCWSITKKVLPALLGAIIYMIAPYHFLTVYVAAAIGSAFQFAFIPLIFLGVYEVVVQKRNITGSMLLAVGFAGSMLSHLMSTVMVVPFVFLWSLLLLAFYAKQSWKLWLSVVGKLVIASLLAIALAAFYLFPLFSYKSAIIADSAGGFRSLYESNFVKFTQLLYSPWGFGPIISNAKDGEISMQVGVVQWLGVIALIGILLLAFGTTFTTKKKGLLKKLYQVLRIRSIFKLNFDRRLPTIILIIFGTICFAMLEISQPLWRFANEYMTLDYPWRLLLLAVFFGSAATALALSYVKPQILKIVAIVLLITLAWYTNRNHIGVNLYTQVAVEDYVDAETTTNTFAEYLPIKASSEVMRKKHPFILESSTVATISAQSAVSTDADVFASVDGIYTLRHYAFPSLEVLVDNQPVTTSVNSDGLLQILLTQGQHVVTIRVLQTPVVTTGAVLSLVTITSFMGYILFRIIKRYVKK